MSKIANYLRGHLLGEYIDKNCCNSLEEENEMDFRSCGLEIYKYDKKYIFFGDIDMYRGIMPSVFSKPILAIKKDYSVWPL